MGGVEDDEPPSKRVKVSSLELMSLLNNCAHTQPAYPLGGLMAKRLPSHGKEETVGSKGVIKKVEFVRIITKALYSIGYERTAALLEEESGIHLHSSVVNLFRKQLLNGNWDESVTTLHKIGVIDETILKPASFMILEQKFFELLENNRVMNALKTLRSEITPLGINKKRVHELCGCVVSPSDYPFNGFRNRQGAEIANSRMNLLEELQKLLPPTIMIPERRLEHLVEQALSVQREACIFHNSLDNSLSLYSDHHCGREHIPSQTIQVLREHNDDVLFLRFSNTGKYLASASSDKSAIIWEVHSDGEVKLKYKLLGHLRPILVVQWSPDDSMLLTCGMEEVVKCWNTNSGDCICSYQKDNVGLISCAWFPDGRNIITGLTDKSICMWDLDGNELNSWKGQKSVMISDMAITADSRWIISICKETAILLFDREVNFERFIVEDHTIISFSVSGDDNFLLVNLINQEIHLWSISGELSLLARYKGHKRSRFVVHSCFGGLEQAFIASGSEDSQVYIWHRTTGELIMALPGHSGTVNCVSWNPTNPHMLASGSDDHTIRIWGLHRANLKRKDVSSNGNAACCNGNSKL